MLSLALLQCVLVVSLFNVKMSNATVKRHNNDATVDAIAEFFKS
jgi:hypothetical protein